MTDTPDPILEALQTAFGTSDDVRKKEYQDKPSTYHIYPDENDLDGHVFDEIFITLKQVLRENNINPETLQRSFDQYGHSIEIDSEIHNHPEFLEILGKDDVKTRLKNAISAEFEPGCVVIRTTPGSPLNTSALKKDTTTEPSKPKPEQPTSRPAESLLERTLKK